MGCLLRRKVRGSCLSPVLTTDSFCSASAQLLLGTNLGTLLTNFFFFERYVQWVRYSGLSIDLLIARPAFFSLSSSLFIFLSCLSSVSRSTSVVRASNHSP